MNKKITLYSGIAFLAGILIACAIFLASAGNGNRQANGRNANVSQDKQAPSAASEAAIDRKNCLADDCLAVQDLEYPAGELSAEAKDALDEAIDDEYKALATYEAVIGAFGSVRPFSMIKGAEERHIASLKTIYEKYGLEVPENSWSGKVSAPGTLKEACGIGVEAEIANAALYKDKLLPAVAGYDDIVSVFTSLMNASQQKHLQAFERCD